MPVTLLAAVLIAAGYLYGPPIGKAVKKTGATIGRAIVPHKHKSKHKTKAADPATTGETTQ